MYTTIYGKLVRLRPWQSGGDLYSFTSASISARLSQIGPYWNPLIKQNQLFEKDGAMDMAGCCLFAIERLTDSRLIGLEICELNEGGPLGAEVGTIILEEYQGRGAGTEAKQLAMCFLFEHFPLERIGAFTQDSNLKAQRSMELCGMEFEGRMRCAWPSNGRLADRLYYVIFREKWEALPIRSEAIRGCADEAVS